MRNAESASKSTRYAAGAAHHDRTEGRVVERAHNHLDAVRHHALDQQAAQLIAEPAFEVARCGAHGVVVGERKAYRLAFRLVQERWPHRFERNGKTERRDRGERHPPRSASAGRLRS